MLIHDQISLVSFKVFAKNLTKDLRKSILKHAVKLKSPTLRFPFKMLENKKKEFLGKKFVPYRRVNSSGSFITEEHVTKLTLTDKKCSNPKVSVCQEDPGCSLDGNVSY